MLALVVDDSRAMRMILRRIMAEQGYEVVEAADGQEALDVLEGGARRPDPVEEADGDGEPDLDAEHRARRHQGAGAGRGREDERGGRSGHDDQ